MILMLLLKVRRKRQAKAGRERTSSRTRGMTSKISKWVLMMVLMMVLMKRFRMMDLKDQLDLQATLKVARRPRDLVMIHLAVLHPTQRKRRKPKKTEETTTMSQIQEMTI